MTEQFDFIFHSGREGLSVDDRRGLLAADELEITGAGRPPGADNSHLYGSLVGQIRSVQKPSAWGLAWLSRVECQVLAWRRGGWQEVRRVRRDQETLL